MDTGDTYNIMSPSLKTLLRITDRRGEHGNERVKLQCTTMSNNEMDTCGTYNIMSTSLKTLLRMTERVINLCINKCFA